jgi:hypothetical protein
MWQSASAYFGDPVTDPHTGKTTVRAGTRPDIVHMATFALRVSF